MATIPPASPHSVESSVVNANLSKVWSRISTLDFSFWGLVESSKQLSADAGANTIGATFALKFKDGVNWTIQLSELSNVTNSLSFEVISCDPPMSFSAVNHTISLRPVTSNNTTFIEWTTDFSNDASAETSK